MAQAAQAPDEVVAAQPLIDATVAAATRSRRGLTMSSADWAAAILPSGLGEYHEARDAAQRAAADGFWAGRVDSSAPPDRAGRVVGVVILPEGGG